MNLSKYGYDEYFELEFKKIEEKDFVPARIMAEHKSAYIVMTDKGEMPATLSGKYRHLAEESGDYPSVGDFVGVIISCENDRAVIYKVLPRKTCFYRSDTWDASGVQVLGANFDMVFICMSLNKDYNLPRIERYLMARESGANIALILTKADLCHDAEIKAAMCEAVCKDVPVFVVSAVTGQGLESIRPYFDRGKTVAALGSSGVGKSTLVNALFGQEIMKTAAVREDDDRGRHTTVSRQIILLPSGGLYLDTPGLREIGIVQAEESLSDMFSDIESLLKNCRFSDCRHNNEPGCAVREALESGELEVKRWERYQRLKHEARYSEDKAAFLKEKTEKFKGYTKMTREKKKRDRK